MESNNEEQDNSTPGTPISRVDLLNQQIVDWIQHLDNLARHGAEQQQLDYCNAQIDRLTKELQAEADQA